MNIKVTGMDKLKKNLHNLMQGIERNSRFTFTIPSDIEGFIERKCPNNTCLRKFKVNFEDWSQKIKPNDRCFCPFCKHEANEASWFTTEQLDEARKNVKEILSKVIKSKGMYTAPKQFSMAATEILVTKSACEICHCRYSYVGSSFYCPSCGQRKLNYKEQYAKIRDIIQKIDVITTGQSPDATQNIKQTLIENSLKEIVDIFQVNMEILYLLVSSTVRKNSFQRIIGGSQLWQESKMRIKYSDFLSQIELDELNEVFQKRHLLVHNQGEIDSSYLLNSLNKSAKIGTKIVITESDVILGSNIAEALIDRLKASVADRTLT